MLNRTAILVLAAAILAIVAPIPTCLTLAVVGVVVLVGGYVSVGALTGAVIAPVLIAIGIGIPTRAFAISVVIGLVVILSQRAHLRRLRAGVEPQLGKFFTRSIPGAKPGVGLFATPAPHGLLGRSAMTPGAVFIILLSVLAAILVAGALRGSA
ncbi:MAG: hypothetical protein ACJ796_05015 [Gemmatimonadaceae bacterium]